jgi:hypothetical protein
MTTRGTRWALAVAVLIALALPVRVDCGSAGGSGGRCSRAAAAPSGSRRTSCTDYEIEPLGFYLIERLVQRDVGFAYSRDTDCR